MEGGRYDPPEDQASSAGRAQAYARNARTHSKKQIAEIAASIKAFGFNNPVLIDQYGAIVAGHGRVEAAKLLGLGSVPVIRLEHLTDAEKRAYILADNKLAEKAGSATALGAEAASRYCGITVMVSVSV